MGNTPLKVITSFFIKHTGNKKNDVSEPTVRLPYSWQKSHVEFDIKELSVSNLSGEIIHRQPAIEGQQFVVENCSDCLVTTTQLADSVFIDDCRHCKIVLGCVRGSVFLRNCKECLVVTVCGQLRTRDCHDMTVFLFCSSQPSIETSSHIRFGCVSIDYPRLGEHLKSASLDDGNNLWYQVYDFTPDTPSNWTLLAADDLLQHFLSVDELLHCFKHDINLSRAQSRITFTHPSLQLAPEVTPPTDDISQKFYSLV